MGSGREVREGNTKSQTPSSREIPESKHQKPSSKHQRNPKFQAPNRSARFELGSWSLELLWCLGLGVWSFNRREAFSSREGLDLDGSLADRSDVLPFCPLL